MAQLSIVMIVKDEADCLGDCLEAIRGIADEIVIGDTGSTDDTAAIARAHGARVLPIPWCDDFAAARNAVLAHATGDWLLHLDADEVVDPENAARIRALIDQNPANIDAVEITLANYSDDPRAWRWIAVAPDDPWARGHAGYLPVPLLRLFRNRRGFQYREPVHENITESVAERGGEVHRAADLLIHHYGYDPNPDTRARKARLYHAIARRKAAEHPADVKALHDLAEQAIACGETAEAEDAARRALALAPDHLGAGTTLANLLLNRGDLEAAQALLQAMLHAGHDRPHLHLAQGAIATVLGHLEEARRHITRALALDPRAPLAYLQLARVYDLQGDAEHAARELALARDLCPGIAELSTRVRAHQLRREGEGLIRAGFLEQALECFVSGLRLDPLDPLLHNAIGVAAHALGDAPRARECFQRALQLAHGFTEAAENLRALTPSDKA